ERPNRIATTTTTGKSAATAPLGLISAVSNAEISIVNTSKRKRLEPARATSLCPTHVVTPVASSPSLTTNNDAMKRTVGSPKPDSASPTVRIFVKYNDSATPIATISTGIRCEMNSTTATPSIRKQVVLSLIVRSRHEVIALSGSIDRAYVGP